MMNQTFRQFYDNLPGIKTESMAYAFWCAGWKAAEEATMKEIQEAKEKEEAIDQKLDELVAKLDAILQSCSGWKKCNDGSYEMALDGRGYYSIVDQISTLREAQMKTEIRKYEQESRQG